MSWVITKELAEKIVKKRQATELDSGGAHAPMGVYHNGILVAQFGIRRGSEKDKGHDHVQKQLKVSTNFAKQLAICTKSREQWIDLMVEKGFIDDGHAYVFIPSTASSTRPIDHQTAFRRRLRGFDNA